MNPDDGAVGTRADGQLLGRLASMTPAPSCEVRVGGRTFVPDSMSISESEVPIRGPGMRGGVYHTGTSAFRVACTTSDPSIAKVLTQAMLGPSTDFAPVVITASTTDDGGDGCTGSSGTVLITANLVGYVQKRDGTTTLNMVAISASGRD